MDIKNFSDLAKIADICRKKGIKQLKITQDGVEFQMGDRPEKQVKADKGSDKIDVPVINEEDVLFWSSGVSN